MRNTTLFAMICVGILFASALSPVSSASFSDSVSIGRYFGNLQGAVSYTFDDGIRNQFDSAVPVLNLYGIKGTFGVIVGPLLATDSQARAAYPDSIGGSASWHQLKVADSMGHEICNHTWSHPNLPMIEKDSAELNHQVNDSWDTLSKKLGKRCVSFFYPYNAVDTLVRIKVHERHWFAREYQTAISGASTVTNLNNTVDNSAVNKTWVVFMIHGISAGFDVLHGTALLRQHFAYVNTIRNKVWVETFGAIGRYSMERDSGHISAQRTSATSATVNISCKLDTTIFNQPLTLVIPAPGAKAVSAYRQGTGIAVFAKLDTNRIYVDITPNGPSVMVTWSNATELRNGRKADIFAPAPRQQQSVLVGPLTRHRSKGSCYSLQGRQVGTAFTPGCGMYLLPPVKLTNGMK